MGEPDSFTQQGLFGFPEKVIMDRKTQNQEILAWLKSGKSITPLEALKRFGCFRLGGRIHELRAAGNQIVTNTVTKNGKHFAEYRLEKPDGNRV